MIRIIYTCGSRSVEFSTDTEMYITDIDGLSYNDITINETELATQAGSSRDNLRTKPKNITFEGRIQYTPLKRSTILAAILPCKMARIRYIDDQAGIDRYIEGTPSRTPSFSNNPTWQSFQFTFHVFFPYWRDINDTVISFVSVDSAFMLPRSFSSTVPWYISKRNSKPLQTIFNNGSTDAGFIVRWTAQSDATGPRITRVDSQETISFTNLSIRAGDIVEVSTYDDNKYAHLIRDGVTSNIFNAFDDDASFWKLAVGYNSVRGGAISGESGVYCDLIFNNTYVGI